MTMTKHPNDPDLWVATDPKDFIGWVQLDNRAYAQPGKMVICTMQRKVGEVTTIRKIICEISILPINVIYYNQRI